MNAHIDNGFVPDKLGYKNEELLSNDNLIIMYYPEYRLVHYVWKQPTKEEGYRNAFLAGLELTKNLETEFFISDIRRQGIVSPDDRKWFQEVILKRGVDAGFMKAAIVFDGNVFKKYYVNLIIRYFVNTEHSIKTFQDVESASKWLLQNLVLTS